MSLLSVSSLSAHYGPAQALFDVSFTVDAGECLALMGRNGMGKTTTLNTVCKLVRPTAGQITVAGTDTATLPPYKVARLGVGLVPEGRRVFGPLTVEENLLAAARTGAFGLPQVFDLFPRLEERRRQQAGTLSGGEQQMLAISRALMTNPKLLLLDEATEGLAPVVRQEIWQAVARLKAETGLGIVVVDKVLAELRQVADRGVIVARGCTVWDGPLDALTPALQSDYLGV